LDIQVLHYSNINRDQLFHILHLRTEVFVVEQNCPYQELDSYDLNSFHVFGTINGKINCAARIVPFLEKRKVVIGRVCVDKNFRKKGYARMMMNKILNFINENLPNMEVELSAQTYLQKFYHSFDFVSVGNVYLEDGIEHILMKK
tara:strand:- start:27 stop:461 length:435 start_codon:yes stop_codon:yes gene_type:complete